jgi:hypothetical protein
MKPTDPTQLGNASKLFRVLVVGGLSLAATTACSSSSPEGGDQDSATGSEDADASGDSASQGDTGSPAETGSGNDSTMMNQDAAEAAATMDVMAGCIGTDACVHGLCSW